MPDFAEMYPGMCVVEHAGEKAIQSIESAGQRFDLPGAGASSPAGTPITSALSCSCSTCASGTLFPGLLHGTVISRPCLCGDSGREAAHLSSISSTSGKASPALIESTAERWNVRLPVLARAARRTGEARPCNIAVCWWR